MGWLLLGLLLGLLVGAGAILLVLRSVGRITGTSGREVRGLLLDGLLSSGTRDGIAAQRALARRLKRAGSRTASGRSVAADELTVHVSPEDHAAIEAALGLPAAQADLTDFYRDHASQHGWLVGREPRVTIVRDISLRPRQSFVQAATHAPTGQELPPDPTPPRAPAPRLPPPADDATTDVLPRAGFEDAFPTAVYPKGPLPGDLVAVHGTDVRTVPAESGVLRIGRGRQNDLVLERPGIGRDHLVLEVRGDAWWAVPGTTQSATLVDGVPLDAPRRIDGTASLELGRGVRVRVSVEPA